MRIVIVHKTIMRTMPRSSFISSHLSRASLPVRFAHDRGTAARQAYRFVENGQRAGPQYATRRVTPQAGRAKTSGQQAATGAHLCHSNYQATLRDSVLVIDGDIPKQHPQFQAGSPFLATTHPHDHAVSRPAVPAQKSATRGYGGRAVRV